MTTNLIGIHPTGQSFPHLREAAERFNAIENPVRKLGYTTPTEAPPLGFDEDRDYEVSSEYFGPGAATFANTFDPGSYGVEDYGQDSHSAAQTSPPLPSETELPIPTRSAQEEEDRESKIAEYEKKFRVDEADPAYGKPKPVGITGTSAPDSEAPYGWEDMHGPLNRDWLGLNTPEGEPWPGGRGWGEKKMRRRLGPEGWDPSGENIAELLDPTGIASWDDANWAHKQYRLGEIGLGELALETAGALPGFGMLARPIRAAQTAVTAARLRKAQLAQRFGNAGDGVTDLDNDNNFFDFH